MEPNDAISPENSLLPEVVQQEITNLNIDFKRPIGRVYHADGSITENVTRVFIQRNNDGTLNSAYPVFR